MMIDMVDKQFVHQDNIFGVHTAPKAYHLIFCNNLFNIYEKKHI